MAHRSQVGDRLAVLAAAFGTVATLLAVRLVWLGAVADASSEAVVTELDAARGSLWDTKGQLLAVEDYVYEVGVAPPAVADPATFGMTVGPVVGRSGAELAAELSSSDATWLVLHRSAPADVAVKLSEASLRGLFLTPRPRRAYALGPSAAHVTGFLTEDGVAHYGVEGYHDALLQGQRGRLTGALGTMPGGFEPPRRGTDLVLTIDRELQATVAEILTRSVASEDAVAGTAIVMDPRTGDVLAMTSVPTFDPNDIARGDPSAFLDPAVSHQYEPGSVIKAMTMAIALDAGAVTPGSTYHDPGYVSYGGAYITNWDRSVSGTMNMTQLMQHSLNVGAVHIADTMGKETFYDGLARFGFGAPTGIDAAGEIGGVLRTHRDPVWTAADLAVNSFGQGMASTPIQVAAAMAAIANDGILMRPRLVRAEVDEDGTYRERPVGPGRKIVGAAAARDVRVMLREAVDGYTVLADVPGYTAAGKTGTSQIPTADGYTDDDTITSFVGFLPSARPELVIYVKIDRPRNELAADAAAPVFRDIAAAAVMIRDVTPDVPSSLPGAAK